MSCTSRMSTMTHVTLQQTQEDTDNRLHWSCIEWAEGGCQTEGGSQTERGSQTEGGSPEQSQRGTHTEGGSPEQTVRGTQTEGGSPGQTVRGTQTEAGSPEQTARGTQTEVGSPEQTARGTQTSSPLIMRLRPSSLEDSEGLAAPFFHFDRQAPGRISTSPTLRRMRSTRRPLSEHQETPMSPTQEEPSPEAPLSPLSPGPRIISPLALSGSLCEVQHVSSSWRQRTKSHRSKTFDNGISFPRPERHSLHLSLSTDFVFPESDSKKEPSYSRLQQRRRSSVVVSLSGLDVSPGDLFVSNSAAHLLNGTTLTDSKKSKWPFSRRSTTKMGSVSDVEKHLSSMQVQDWRNVDLQKYKDSCVAEFLRDHVQVPVSVSVSDPQVYKLQEAVWELFTSECVYFLDQLMVLKEVFLSTLSELQTQNCLTDVDAWRLFANLSELCLVSFGFLNKLLTVVTDTQSTGGPSLLLLLDKVFQESLCHSLQKYCLNYSTALQYMDALKPRDDFGTYVKWCERNPQCRRLQLRDLLVAPLQRLTRYPLLLRNIGKRLETNEDSRNLHSVAEQVDTAICDLEGKVKWLDNYQKVKQLRDALVWLPVWERDKRAFVPENLKHLLKAVTLENLITHRSLLHEGKLVLTENTKLLDVYLFLFDEFLLITKIKRNKKRSPGPDQTQDLDQLLKDGCSFTVVDQPLSLDRVQVKNIDQLNASTSGLPLSFILMHQNRYQQCIGAFILQAPSETAKRAWMSKMEDAVGALLKQDSQQLRLKSASLWLESSQI